jgi:hypothetical protein
MRGAVLPLLLALAGCSTEPYPLGGNDAGDTADDRAGENGESGENAENGENGENGDAPDADDGRDEGSGPCYPIGPDDTCNGVDDDCNGTTDDLFDLTRDPNNCGSCGHRCVGPGARFDCTASACVFRECELGFADIDGDLLSCEYRCPLFPTQSEECNGIDDDCDGDIDEPAELPAPPTGLCRELAGTPCAGVTMVCVTRGTDPPTTGWFCDYPPAVEFDPSIPNGIALEETLCDGLDGDCDGVPDDPFTDLGLECDNGLLGACRDPGARICDPAAPTRTMCDLTLPPDALYTVPAVETCNGIDDDCDGIVDNATGAGRVIDDMVEIDRGGAHYWIDRFEASRPDATASAPGVSDARTCSRADALPWTSVTFDAATAACARGGKRLCTGAQWLAACDGGAGRLYPYGNAYDSTFCNGLDFDGLPGGADDDVLLPTGDPSLSACVSLDGTSDLSGNAREWTDDVRGDTGAPSFTPIAVTRGGGYDSPRMGLACTFDLSRAAATTRLPTLGFRCCSDTAP